MTTWTSSIPATPGDSPHAVQFYEREEFLYRTVGDFLAEGIEAGEPLVVIATPEHRRAFTAELTNKGFDIGAVEVLFLDARETLGSFMSGELPDEARFNETVGRALEQTLQRTGVTRIRAYGEMVDLLWRDGKPDAAIRLEEFWNDLGYRYSFALLCAYPIGNFYKTSDSSLFEDICRAHHHVNPTETFSDAPNEDEKAKQISFLQHRALALETEIEYRQELEKSLREALAARRHAEAALVRSERELKDTFENATIAMHWVGPDGKILWANAAELNLLGYSQEEYIGRSIADFHADRATIDDILGRLLAGESIHDRQATLHAKDGSVRQVKISSNALFEDGKFIHTRCFTRDVTEEKRFEVANAVLLDAATVLYRSLDFESRLRDLNNVIVPRLADWCDIDLSSVEREAEVFPTRIVVPMKVVDRVLGTIAFGSSESGRRYSHSDLPLATELARRAAIAIENARLYHHAQEANRAKDEFLATLSHELRTPLTAILGWSRMLLLGSLDEATTRTALDTIERSARTQATLIDDLLDLSRVVTGKLTIESELVDLGSCVESAVQTIKLAADAKGIRVDIRDSAERLVINGDPTRIQQIIWNLLTNAIKFSNNDSAVSIAIERDGDAARITVRDVGRGIDAAFLPHVFEPFLQADAASTRAYGGLGLGLAIVKYITELHGGTVSAKSAGLGTGAEFIVTLPLVLRRSMDVAEIRAEVPVDLTGMRLLLVDDDNDTRNLVRAVLRRCGADVEVAESVDRACALLHVRTPDVVITDIAMPGRDGFSLLAHMRATASTREVPAVALTASSDRNSESDGFHAYVRKPIDPLEFARVIGGLKTTG